MLTPHFTRVFHHFPIHFQTTTFLSHCPFKIAKRLAKRQRAACVQSLQFYLFFPFLRYLQIKPGKNSGNFFSCSTLSKYTNVGSVWVLTFLRNKIHAQESCCGPIVKTMSSFPENQGKREKEKIATESNIKINMHVCVFLYKTLLLFRIFSPFLGIRYCCKVFWRKQYVAFFSQLSIHLIIITSLFSYKQTNNQR